MSQEKIDAFYQWLKDHPEEMKRAKKMKVDDLISFASKHGFFFEKDEIKARQALMHMMHGT